MSAKMKVLQAPCPWFNIMAEYFKRIAGFDVYLTYTINLINSISLIPSFFLTVGDALLMETPSTNIWTQSVKS